MLCAFWWKKLERPRTLLRQLLGEHYIKATPVPQWFVTGRTVLVPKDGCEGRPDQYRPITCLNTAYKFYTGVVYGLLLQHVEDNGILPLEQNAMRRGRRGCLSGRWERRQNLLSVAWVDYQKAFDRVPHGWLESMLKIIKAPDGVVKAISQLIPMWETVMNAGTWNEPKNVPIKYKRGLFLGDSLSPLLFCLSIIPISTALEMTPGYQCAHLRLMHLLYMDDLKVYAEDPKSLEAALKTVDRVSGAVGMKLGLRKCAVAHMSRGGKAKFEADLELPECRAVKNLVHGQAYRYLGIEQVFQKEFTEVTSRLRREYLKRIRSIWRSNELEI